MAFLVLAKFLFSFALVFFTVYGDTFWDKIR